MEPAPRQMSAWLREPPWGCPAAPSLSLVITGLLGRLRGMGP